MKIFKTATDLREGLKGCSSLGFVATMGALHEGHGALVEESQKENEKTCVSLFVNPAQFNNPKDFETYPDRTKEDIEYCAKLGVDCVFMPSPSEMYQPKETINFSELDITKDFEGAHRPGHFNGVLLVVMKLLNIIKPERAYFGKKDYQQYLIIKNMTEQFFMKTEIVGVETYRDAEGLALSSRNYNLSAQGHKKAQGVAKAFLASKSREDFLESVNNNIDLEYYGEDWGRALMAHYIEGVRLIDNKPVIKPLIKPPIKLMEKRSEV